jgi:2'-5' RNA ligase
VSPEPISTAVLAAVPEAEPVVGRWRDRYDMAATTGIPAHITILFPFVPPEQITSEDEAALADVMSSVARFSFRLARVARFDDVVLYLAPEPAESFRSLIRAVFTRFPTFPPYGGAHPDLVPHLTIAHRLGGDGSADFDQIEAAVAPLLPIACRATEVLLMEGNGRWQARARIPLGG